MKKVICMLILFTSMITGIMASKLPTPEQAVDEICVSVQSDSSVVIVFDVDQFTRIKALKGARLERIQKIHSVYGHCSLENEIATTKDVSAYFLETEGNRVQNG